MPSPIRTSRLARRATNSFVDWEDPIFQDPASRLLEPQIIVYEAPVCHAHNAEASSSSNFSACGFTALNYVRLAWKLEIEGITDAELLRRMISQVMVDVSPRSNASIELAVIYSVFVAHIPWNIV
jgi:hypothetical protein